jgi:hypothetical protein
VHGSLRSAMAAAPPKRFVRDRQALDETLAEAKQISCPHCHRTGMLVGHGLLMGYAERSSDREVRGRRLLCSGRLRRSGCGRTFSVLIATVIAGFAVRTRILSRLLEAVVGGSCRKAAWEQIGTGLSLRSGYRLWARLMGAQSRVRTMLCAIGPPPAIIDARPVAQMLAHLRHALAPSECVLGSLQLALQRDVFG